VNTKQYYQNHEWFGLFKHMYSMSVIKQSLNVM